MLMAGSGFSLMPEDRTAEAADLLLCFCEGDVLMAKTEGPDFVVPSYEAVQALLPKGQPLHHLFSMEGRGFFLLDLKDRPALGEEKGLSFQPIGIFRHLPASGHGFALITAWHLAMWYRRNRHCGGCGALLTPSQTERALCCTVCGQVVYPTICPAVSVAVTDGDRLLMARNANGAFRHFSLIAGYVEAGESLEETVRREVLEEVGLRVKNIRYIQSQPWGLSQSLMLGFHAQLDGGDRITLQESELAEARWFRREEIQAGPSPISLSFELIERFRLGRL